MRLFRILTVTVGLGGFGIAAGGASCNPVSDFQCSTSDDCIAQGEGGVCEANNFCTFPDETCESGKRWHDRASSLAGMCFGEGTTGTDTDDPTMMGTSGTTEDPTTGVDPNDGSSSSGEPTTGDPSTTGEPTTGDPPTTGGSSSGSGGAGMCDAMYGGATDYMLCEETADSCSFNVTTANAASCAMVCESFGGSCTAAADNADDPCVAATDTTCDDATLGNLICTCSL